MKLESTSPHLAIAEIWRQKISQSPEPLADIYTLDHGNTNPTLACFRDGECAWIKTLKEVFEYPEMLKKIFKKGTWIFASIVGKTDRIPSAIMGQCYTFRDDYAGGQFLGMPVKYGPTLGTDRLVLAHLAYECLHAKLLEGPGPVIDAGTFTTMDFVDESGFLGGVILTGVRTILESYVKGAQLGAVNEAEFLEFIRTNPKGLGNTSEEAKMLGVLRMLQGSWELHRAAFSAGRNDFSWALITGGQSSAYQHILAPQGDQLQIKDHHLIHWGLYLMALKKHQKKEALLRPI